jgi:hypothetical protein
MSVQPTNQNHCATALVARLEALRGMTSGPLCRLEQTFVDVDPTQFRTIQNDAKDLREISAAGCGRSAPSRMMSR